MYCMIVESTFVPINNVYPIINKPVDKHCNTIIQFKVDAVDRFRALEPVTAGVLFRHTSQRHTKLGLSGTSIKEDV